MARASTADALVSLHIFHAAISFALAACHVSTAPDSGASRAPHQQQVGSHKSTQVHAVRSKACLDHRKPGSMCGDPRSIRVAVSVEVALLVLYLSPQLVSRHQIRGFCSKVSARKREETKGGKKMIFLQIPRDKCGLEPER